MLLTLQKASVLLPRPQSQPRRGTVWAGKNGSIPRLASPSLLRSGLMSSCHQYFPYFVAMVSKYSMLHIVKMIHTVCLVSSSPVYRSWNLLLRVFAVSLGLNHSLSLPQHQQDLMALKHQQELLEHQKKIEQQRNEQAREKQQREHKLQQLKHKERGQESKWTAHTDVTGKENQYVICKVTRCCCSDR